MPRNLARELETFKSRDCTTEGKFQLKRTTRSRTVCVPFALLVLLSGLPLASMERRERRHKASSKATSSVVETKAESGKKPAKLVLKRPSALSPPGRHTDLSSTSKNPI